MRLVEQLRKEAEFSVVAYVVRKRGDGFCECFQLGDGSSSDAGCGLFVHGMDQHVVVSKGEQPVGLVTMSEEPTRDRLSHDERDHRVTGKPSCGVSVRSSGSCKMDPGDFFAAAVGLAFDIQDRNDRAVII